MSRATPCPSVQVEDCKMHWMHGNQAPCQQVVYAIHAIWEQLTWLVGFVNNGSSLMHSFCCNPTHEGDDTSDKDNYGQKTRQLNDHLSNI